MNTRQTKKGRGTPRPSGAAKISTLIPAATSPAAVPSPAGLPLPKLTLELALWLLLVAVALLVRVADLGAAPLHAEESLRALGAWQLTSWTVPWEWQEPLTSTLTALPFLLFGANDFVARLVPAIAGAALVAILAGLRPVIGARGALGAAAILSFSPSLVFFSRFLSGDILAATLALGLVLCLWELFAKRRPAALVAVAILLALLLNSGPSGWTFVFATALAAAVLFAAGQLPSGWVASAAALRDDGRAWLSAAFAFFVTFVLASTGGLVNAGFLGLPSLTSWLTQFGGASGEDSAGPLALLLVYEPLIVSLGLAAAVRDLGFGATVDPERHALRRYLLVWALGGLTAFLLSSRPQAGGILMGLLPLAILGGELLGDITTRIDRRISWPGTLLLLPIPVLLAYLWLLLGRATRGAGLSQQALLYLGLAALGAIVLLSLAWVNLEGRHGLAVLASLGLLVLAVYSLHTTWWVAGGAGAVELLVRDAPTPQVRQAAEAVREVASGRFLADTGAVIVDPSLKAPFAWYLRDLENTVYSPSLSLPSVAILTPRAQGELSGYARRSLPLATVWRSAAPSPGQLWRWAMFREPYGPVDTTRFALYVRPLPTSP